MKIVVLDGYTENPGDLSWESLNKYGEVEIYDRTENKDDVITGRIAGAEIVLTNKTPISKKVIEYSKDLKLICVLATGYNVIDTAAAKAAGVTVCNVPSYGTYSVAQYSIALLLEICCHIGHHNDTVQNGVWTKCEDWCYWDYPLIELSGKTIGIIGFGRIGQAEGAIAQALGMNVIAYDPYPNESGMKLAKYTDLDELYKKSDVISLHCNLTRDNEGMINQDSIAKMKDGVILINNSRGQLVNERDLAEALKSGKVGAAGLDVVSTEPISEDNLLLNIENCLITPHISWASIECRQRIMNTTIFNIESYLHGETVNAVV